MAGQHENDNQVKGFARSVEEAQRKVLEKKLKQKVTFQDLANEFWVLANSINEQLVFLYENGVNKDGRSLKEVRKEAVAKINQMQTEGHSPIPASKEAAEAVQTAADDVAAKADALGAAE